MLIFSYYLKGCVQGYGSYEELTSSGVDPRELFDDIEDVESPNFVATEIVMEECRDTVEEADQQSMKSSNDMLLIPTEKTRQCVRSENDHVPAFTQVCDRGSVYTTPSMLSLISMPNKLDDNTRTNTVGPLFSYS